MDPWLVCTCVLFILLFCLIVCWHVCSQRCRMRKRLERTMVMTECFQPHLVCKAVPCQHPYYRVLAEYSENNHTRLPNLDEDDKTCLELPPNLTPPLPQCEGRKFSYSEWSRKLSVGSIPRRSSVGVYPYRKLSTNGSLHNSYSRRSSDSITPPNSPVYETTATVLPQDDSTPSNFKI